MTLRSPMTARSMRASVIMHPSATIAWRMLAPLTFAGGKETRVGVNRISPVKKIVGRNRVRQCQVGFKEGPHCADIFPIPLKNVGKNLVLLQRSRNDVFAK